MENLRLETNGVWYLNSDKHYTSVEVLKFLYSDAYANGKSFSRCCLHANKNSKLMVMFLAFVNSYVFPAHRHLWKDESYIILDGNCHYIEFLDDGSKSYQQELRIGDVFYNTNRTYHQLVPLCEKLGLIELTTGPMVQKPLEFL